MLPSCAWIVPHTWITPEFTVVLKNRKWHERKAFSIVQDRSYRRDKAFRPDTGRVGRRRIELAWARKTPTCLGPVLTLFLCYRWHVGVFTKTRSKVLHSAGDRMIRKPHNVQYACKIASVGWLHTEQHDMRQPHEVLWCVRVVFRASEVGGIACKINVWHFIWQQSYCQKRSWQLTLLSFTRTKQDALGRIPFEHVHVMSQTVLHHSHVHTYIHIHVRSALTGVYKSGDRDGLLE